MTGIKKILSENPRWRNKAGFTLIELVVSITLFATIVLGAAQIFKLVISSQRSSLATQNVQESLRYFLEVISKEVRMAQRNNGVCAAVPSAEIYAITTDTSNNSVLNFKNYYNQCVTYQLAPDTGVPTTLRFKITRNTNGTTLADFISPAAITLDNMHFVLTEGSSTQPLITVNLQAHAVNAAQFKSAIIIQTSLASRYYQN
jgi:prepilin-type N-terminal cleavage/methylation domain-containing protein